MESAPATEVEECDGSISRSRLSGGRRRIALAATHWRILMRRISLFSLIVLTVGFMLLTDRGSEADAVPSPAPGGFKWEYKVYTEVELANLSEAKSLETSLNKLGEDGWELVAIRSSNDTPAALARKGSSALFILKRLKQGK